MNNKPSNYNKYFNSNGSKKANPYNNANELPKKGFLIKSAIWSTRQSKIVYSLMKDEEKKIYCRKHLKRKMST